jgi:hypothetical protein
MTEKEMRESKAPWPKSKDELLAFIDKMEKEANDYSEPGEGYGKAVYVMSLIATAAFYYASHVVGSTGFQASCADIDFLRRTRSMDDGFQIINYSDLLYPQYEDKIPGYWSLIEKNKEWLAQRAAKLLSESDGMAVEAVLNHWKRLIAS